MQLRLTRRLSITGAILLAIALMASLLAMQVVATPPKAAHAASAPLCTLRPQLCTETAEPWNSAGQYTGHDEPSLLFYSHQPGSGNNLVSLLNLPRDPRAAPSQDGTGTTWGFQLHPAFWYGMIMCDDQAAPNPGATCKPDSDSNLHTSLDPTSPDYFGLTPGQGFMEMQFYPPGWGPVSCTNSDGVTDGKWCAALNIDSVQSNSNTGVANNAACNNLVGPEPVNFAYITKSGHASAPASPAEGFGNQAIVTADTLEFNSGDRLLVDMHDTAAGFQVVITDLTTHQRGSMTASIANGFAHALFQPDATTCTMQPYTFHPMFSTSTPDTRVLWAAHSYNVAFSDEIGHFEYCNAVTPGTSRCDATAGHPNPTDQTPDSDDRGCATAPVVTKKPGNATLTGCLSTDVDFDGPEYQNGTWPGSPGAIPSKVTTPIQFTSPLFRRSAGDGKRGDDHDLLLRNYDQVAFETDLPRIEGSDTSPNNACQRHVSNPADPSPGAGCVNPPNGATFYPIYTTTRSFGECVWQEGGASIPGTINRFGGTSAAEYGGLLLSNYPATGFTITQRYNNFHNSLNKNPCPAIL